MTRKRTRSLGFELELHAAKRATEAAAETFPQCAVPSNVLIYSFLAEIRKQYDERETEKTCEEESVSQPRPGNFARNLKMAMDGLAGHPTRVEDVASLLRVNGVGPKIAEIVLSAGLFGVGDDAVGGDDGAGGAGNQDRDGDNEDLDQSQPRSSQQQQRTAGIDRATKTTGNDDNSKQYVPRLGSANYAFLVVLYRELHGRDKGDDVKGRDHLTKKELMDLAEASGLSSKPINSRGGGSARAYGAQVSKTYYSGWSNFKALVNNGLVRAWGSPKKIALTDAGVKVAHRLVELLMEPGGVSYDCSDSRVIERTVEHTIGRSADRHATRPVVCDSRRPTTSSRAVADSDVEIVLLIDSREQYARSIADKLPDVEVRTLPIGDALWIARNGQEEWVLDWIVERKSIEDLIQSVRVGNRYHSQKYRLQQCGIRHLYYLVEGETESLSSSTDYKLLGTACAKTSVIDGFNVLRPTSFAGTLSLLSRMTRSIRKRVREMGMAGHGGGGVARSSEGGDTAWAQRNGLVAFSEFQARCVGLDKGDTSVQDIWSVMLNEVPGMGRVAVEKVFSNPRHRTCHGFYHAGAVAGGGSQSSKTGSKKVESIVNALFYS